MEIAEDQELGPWDQNGSYLAVQGAASVGGFAVARTTDANVTVGPVIKEMFRGWAPTRSLYVTQRSSVIFRRDAAAPDQPADDGPTPYGYMEEWRFSPDGHYLSIKAPEAVPPGMRLLDLDGRDLVFEAPFVADGRSASWSPGGRYLAFARASQMPSSGLELWVLDTLTPGRTAARLATGLRSADTLFRWLDESRFFYQSMDQRGHVLSLGPSMASDHQTEPLLGFAQLSPNGRCLAYFSNCGIHGETGVCVRSLEPDANATLVSYLEPGWAVWTSEGDRLAIRASTYLEAVNLDGQPFKPQLVSDQAGFITSFTWSPGEKPWLAVLRSSATGSGQALHLWKSDTLERFVVEPGSGFTAQALVWSPDRRAIAIQVAPTNFNSARAPLVLQMMNENGPGDRVVMDELNLPTSAGGWSDLLFQP